jgi:hypothetical protein
VVKARDKLVIDAFEHLVVRLPAKGIGTTEFDLSDERRAVLTAAGKEAMRAHLARRAAVPAERPRHPLVDGGQDGGAAGAEPSLSAPGPGRCPVAARVVQKADAQHPLTPRRPLRLGAGPAHRLRGPHPRGRPRAPWGLPAVVTVVAASDLSHAFEALVQGFGKEQPEITVLVSYGASGSLTAQIKEGAPFDVFFSADMGYPEALKELGLVTDAGVRPYALGQLVVWAPPGSPAPLAQDGVGALTSPLVKHIAIANPQHAPYGRAAVAALKPCACTTWWSPSSCTARTSHRPPSSPRAARRSWA